MIKRVARFIAALAAVASAAASVRAAPPAVVNSVPANARMLAYVPDISTLLDELTRLAPAADMNTEFRRELQRMGLGGVLNMHGSLMIVVPGNTIGVSLMNTEPVFILPVKSQKQFKACVDGRRLGHGLFQGKVEAFNPMLAGHATPMVYTFIGTHAVCARNKKLLNNYLHAASHLTPSQVMGGPLGRKPAMVFRINMAQEGFELGAGLRPAILNLWRSFSAGPAVPLREAQRVVARVVHQLVTQTKSVTFEGGRAGHGFRWGCRVIPVAGSKFAQLIAAQYTIAPAQRHTLPLNHYVLMLAEAFNGRAVDDYIRSDLPAAGHKVKPGKGAATRATAAAPTPTRTARPSAATTAPAASPTSTPASPPATAATFRTPWVVRHARFCQLVLRGSGGSIRRAKPTMYAAFDRYVHMTTIKREIKSMPGLPSGFRRSLVGVELTARHMLEFSVPDDAAIGGRVPKATRDRYWIGRASRRSILLSPAADYPAIQKHIAGATAREKAGGGAAVGIPGGRNAAHGLMFMGMVSARTLERGDPQPQAGSIAFPIHYRPVVLTISHAQGGINFICWAPTQWVDALPGLFTRLSNAF